MLDGVTFESASPEHPDAARLIAAMTAEVTSLYSLEEIAAVREREALRESPMELLLVRRGGRPVGCGGVQRLNDAAAELKRMYLVPDERGSGIAPELTRRVESLAVERGFERIVLNTGARLERAVRLYERMGYVRVPALPGWEDLDFLIWYGKPLG